jgi:hypothetical protein
VDRVDHRSSSHLALDPEPLLEGLLGAHGLVEAIRKRDPNDALALLLEQLKGRIQSPSVLFYPGTLDGASGLRFMGVLEAEHNYRPKIF